MQNLDRVIVTGMIWAAVVAAMLVMFIAGTLEGTMLIPLVGIIFGCSAFATAVIWSRSKENLNAAKGFTNGQIEKGKRSSHARLIQTINSLDDEEADYLLRDIRRRMAEEPDDDHVDLEQLLQRNKQR